MRRTAVAALFGCLLLLLAAPHAVWSQAGSTPTATSTATTTPTPTVTATRAPLDIVSVEPGTLVSSIGGTLSVYGTGFTSGTVVRLVGYGLLSTAYLNGTALTAQVPAGVPVGIYDVDVSDGNTTDVLSQALAVIAATPTPKPTSTPKPASQPPPGQPILTIRNYTVEPAQVKPGEEFAVSIELYNNGSRAGENTLAIFPGGTFLPLGDKGHQLWQLPINATVVVTQKMRAPASIGNGVHQLTVQLEANDWEGNNYKFPTTIPVEVVGASTGEFTGKPEIMIEHAETAPPVLIPGEPFSLTLRLANRGSRTAVNVFATAASSEMAIPASGGDTVYADVIRIDDVVTVTLPLVLGALETGGRQSMPIALSYSDYNGGGYSDQASIGVDVNTSLVKQPQLIIEAYSTAPQFVAPGDTMTLTMRVANVGGGDAERVTLALGGEEGASLAPFVPLDSGNVIFVDLIPMGKAVEISRPLLIDGSAETRAYSLPIELAYDDPRASRHQEIQRLSLIVRKRPELQTSFYQPPGMLMVGVPGQLSLEMVNVGRSVVNITEIASTSPQMGVRMEGLPFVGPLDSGGSAPIDLSVTPQEAGTADLVIAVSYRDDFNQTRVISQTLSVEVAGGMEESLTPQVPGPGGPQGQGPDVGEAETLLQKIGRAIKGFLGLGS